MKMTGLFSNNKQQVRNLNYNFIERHFSKDKGNLIYMGLPSAEMADVLMWRDYINKIYAIEIGREGEEYVRQHNLMLTAAKQRLLDKVKLLRGDVDKIIIDKVDAFGNNLDFPFDLVVLDYCSGIIYAPNCGFKAMRLEALRKLFEYQAEFGKNFMLILSVNLDHNPAEIIKTLDEIGRMIGDNSVINELKNSPFEEARLKVYVLYIIASFAGSYYNIEFNKPIHYEGNKRTRMMNFSFFFKLNKNTFAPKTKNIEVIVNKKMLQVKDGNISESEIELPLMNTKA